jgi:hypothetical protein
MLNIKYIIALIGLIVGFSGNAFGFSKGDVMQSGRPFFSSASNIPMTVSFVDGVATGVVMTNEFGFRVFSKESGDVDHPVINVIQHHLWYNRHGRKQALWKNNNLEIVNNISPIADLGTFIVADYALGKVAGTFSENESVKKVIQVIPEQPRQFLYQNGKMVLASLAARTAGTLVDEGRPGINWPRAKSFGKDAGIQFGTAFSEEYLVNWAADSVLGKEDSSGKEVLKCVFTAGSWIALNHAVRT